jgi:hypothetical protein
VSLSAALDPKEKVARHWEAEACGTRGIEDVDRRFSSGRSLESPGTKAYTFAGEATLQRVP